MLGKAVFSLYAAAAYVVGIGALVYGVGFFANLVVPKGIDSGVAGPVGEAVAMNLLLLLLLPVQRTVMARAAFKEKRIQVVPSAVERSTFVLISGLLLWLAYWQWRPLLNVVWEIESQPTRGLITAIYLAGWSLLLASSFLIDHFDLFGLRQVYFHACDKPYEAPVFVERLVYRWIRHPLMAGFVVAFWAAPTMSQGRLLFAMATTMCVCVGIRLVERDLRAAHGDQYAAYQQRTSMMLPLPRRSS